MLGCPGDTPHASGLLSPHLLTDSREPWLLGEKVSQHISCYYLRIALPLLELCSINNNYDGDRDTCAMRYNGCHFIWMSRKFQGRKMTTKYPFGELKKKQRWEA